MHNLQLKVPHFGGFWVKIRISSTRYLLCRKFADISRKIVTYCSPPILLLYVRTTLLNANTIEYSAMNYDK